jgi:hypothetical protein
MRFILFGVWMAERTMRAVELGVGIWGMVFHVLGKKDFLATSIRTNGATKGLHMAVEMGTEVWTLEFAKHASEDGDQLVFWERQVTAVNSFFAQKPGLTATITFKCWMVFQMTICLFFCICNKRAVNTIKHSFLWNEKLRTAKKEHFVDVNIARRGNLLITSKPQKQWKSKKNVLSVWKLLRMSCSHLVVILVVSFAR